MGIKFWDQMDYWLICGILIVLAITVVCVLIGLILHFYDLYLQTKLDKLQVEASLRENSMSQEEQKTSIVSLKPDAELFKLAADDETDL